MRRFLPFAALLLSLAMALSCGDDDDNPADSGDPGLTLALPKTATALITEYFPAAYSQMDSAAYAAILDDDYVFELISSEVDPNDPDPWWDLHEEMTIAGNMFGGRYNRAGQAVDRIHLAMDERTNVVDPIIYPDKPEGEEWRKVTALVDLLVVVQDPNDPEGTTNFVVSANQIFTVRPNRDDPESWSIYKQWDQEPINKAGSTQDASWSGVKSLFR